MVINRPKHNFIPHLRIRYSLKTDTSGFSLLIRPSNTVGIGLCHVSEYVRLGSIGYHSNLSSVKFCIKMAMVQVTEQVCLQNYFVENNGPGRCQGSPNATANQAREDLLIGLGPSGLGSFCLVTFYYYFAGSSSCMCEKGIPYFTGKTNGSKYVYLTLLEIRNLHKE